MIWRYLTITSTITTKTCPSQNDHYLLYNNSIKLLLVSNFFGHVTELGWLPSDSNVVGTVSWNGQWMWWRCDAHDTLTIQIYSGIGNFSKYKYSLKLLCLTGGCVPVSVILSKSIDDGNEVPCTFFETTKTLYSFPVSNFINTAEFSLTSICWKYKKRAIVMLK